MRNWQAVVKRGIDFALGATAAVLLLPLGLIIALAVVADSSGPALYGARRVGRGGKQFTMHKFRSMAEGADRAGPAVTGAHDYRVTRVGAFLRRTKLDELPQLINVLKGEMSLVGPRPEAPAYVEQWTPAEREVLRFRPGVTGAAQIAFMDEEALLATPDPDAVYESEVMHTKLALDLEYVRNYTVRGDLVLLWRTVAGILTASERPSNKPHRRYTLLERLRGTSARWIVLDAALAALAASLAVGLRIDRNNILAAVATYWVFVPLVMVIRPAGFLLSGAYLRVWRYPTLGDGALFVSSLSVGSLVITLSIFFILQPSGFPSAVGFPRSAIVIEFFLSLLLLGGMRVASRVRQEGLDAMPAFVGGPPKPILIYGAGEAGALLAREMLRNRALRLDPVAFVDDDAGKRGQRIYGIEVAGTGLDLPHVVAERGVSEVIIAMPRAGGPDLRRVVRLCEVAGVAVRTLPSVQELLNETVTVRKVRDVRLEDLLRREPIPIPDAPLWQLVSGHTVLVTGAGGSIGSELCRQVAGLGATRIVLLDRAETPLFNIEQLILRRHPEIEVVTALADVADEPAVERAMHIARPDVVIHAAAQKHVPMSEAHVVQAVLTNVRGTRVIATAAANAQIPTFVFVSTDKAIDPSSVMGATKRLGEEIVRQLAADAVGRFVTVRFGNVLGSQGSVVEIFRRQIADGGPVTVTHADMTRYFMLIPEAVRLILLAGAVGASGAVYVLDMGRPVRIVDLAHDMIRLVARPGQDVEIVFTGLRRGERLEEMLFAVNETPVKTNHPGLLIAQRNRTLSPKGDAVEAACELERVAMTGDDNRLRALLING
jgi:FlaA1/EpsC-like NDP-sugar epimerase/lipopolysaccharide/colanic/teichoic acid biosynthesis glycosyltransferase